MRARNTAIAAALAAAALFACDASGAGNHREPTPAQSSLAEGEGDAAQDPATDRELLEANALEIVLSGPEPFGPTSFEAILDDPDAELTRGDGEEVIVTADELELDFLDGRRYGNGEAVEDGDRISAGDREHWLDRSEDLRRYGPVAYGRVVEEDGVT